MDNLSPRPSLSRLLIKSVSALYFERGLRIGSTLITTIILARHLGLESFGELSYALSWVAVFGVAASLGLDEILVRDAATPNTQTGILEAVCILRLAACVVLFPILASILITTSSAPRGGISLIAAVVLLSPLYSLEQLMYAKMLAGRLAVLGTIEVITTLCFRLYLVLIGASNEWIMFSFFTEAALKVFLVSVYTWKFRLLSPSFIQPKMEKLISVLSQGLPLLAASLAITGYMKLDQIMLRAMEGPEEVAVYSVAVRITEAFYFLPVILGNVLLPALASAKHSDGHSRLFTKLYRYSFYSGLSIAIIILVLGQSFIMLAFGAEYQAAVTYLNIYVLALPLVFLGVVSGKWLVIEGLQMHALLRTIAGLLVNITLNLLLIPRYAGIGAAIATVLSQLIAAFLYDFIFDATRPMAWQKCKSLVFNVKKLK